MFVAQIPVKNLALSTVKYLVTNSSLHEMKTYFLHIFKKSSITGGGCIGYGIGGIVQYIRVTIVYKLSSVVMT